MTNMDPRKVFTWLPKRMTSGSIVWFGWYWIEEYLASVDPRHMWINTTSYTEKEYFLKKLSNVKKYNLDIETFFLEFKDLLK